MDLVEFFSTQPAHSLWLLGGLVCLGVGMIVGEPSVAALGVAAFITAIASLTVSSPLSQLFIWGILSVSLAMVMRGMVPKESEDLRHPAEASVLESIPAGGIGCVAYEGSMWTARCQLSEVAIAAGQIVHVIGREGNTLIVLPTTFPDTPLFDQTL